MNKTIKGVLMFVAGGAIGSLVTWKFTKTYYARVAQEEIDSVKEVFSNNKPVKVVEPIKPFDEVRNRQGEYNNLLRENGYIHSDEEGEAEDDDDAYVISPDEFGELTYETMTYTYYADHVLADEVDDVVDDIEGTIGAKSLLRFGEYEDECVHVRNDRLEIDYEVLLDTRNYYGDIVPFPDPAD